MLCQMALVLFETALIHTGQCNAMVFCEPLENAFRGAGDYETARLSLQQHAQLLRVLFQLCFQTVPGLYLSQMKLRHS